MQKQLVLLAIAGGLVGTVGATPYTSIFTAGEGFTFEFSLSPATDLSAPPSTHTGVGGTIWMENNFDFGPDTMVFRIEAFENSSAESAIFSRLVTCDRFDPATCEGQWAVEGAWQDLQGVFRLTVVSGVFDLFNGCWIGVNTPGNSPANQQSYGRFFTSEEMFTPVPEPSTYVIGFMGLGALILSRRRK